MKLASLKNGRDGRLVVVSRDLARAVSAEGVAPTLQHALDDWQNLAPSLARLAAALESGEAQSAFPFDESACASPLPRAYQWVDGSAYVTHVELVRKARGAELPASFWTDPLMYQGASDRFVGPRDPIEWGGEEWGLDLEAEVAVVVDDVPMGVTREAALGHIKLVMIANDVSARGLIPNELAKGFGFLHGKPATAFSPVAVTPDELGDAWRDGKLHRPLLSALNGRAFGRPDAGTDMTFDFGALVAHAARTRHLGAGTIVGSGTVANEAAREESSGIGHSCLAERRMLETIWRGRPETPWLKPGDHVRIEMRDGDGRSIFGAIDQEVVRYPDELR
ncbi:MAG: fumarylacetoacetate hydrolase family protein [Methylobacteriaceae bacterium]|nr:fumarylacetoacetate hydrolase family protein [Methylobacteriaceae bacterium]